jgi:hypothetical protein
VMERSTRGTGVLRLLKCLRLEPGGSGPVAVRMQVILSGGLTTPGSVYESWPGGHEESLRRTRGDAAGTQSGSYFIERTTVNTGTVPNLALSPASSRPTGLSASTADRSGAGRSRRSTPRPGEPAAWGRAAAVSRREGRCNAGRRPAEWRSSGPSGPGTGDADQASPLDGGRCRPPVR